MGVRWSLGLPLASTGSSVCQDKPGAAWNWNIIGISHCCISCGLGTAGTGVGCQGWSPAVSGHSWLLSGADWLLAQSSAVPRSVCQSQLWHLGRAWPCPGVPDGSLGLRAGAPGGHCPVGREGREQGTALSACQINLQLFT